MPRGIPKAKAIPHLSAAIAHEIVPVGAEHYPGTSTRLPEGVRVRSSHAVQIEFMFEGKRCYETVRGVPTVAHVQKVAEKRLRVNQLIGLGKFEYQAEFPDSRRVKTAESQAAKQAQNHAKTIGEALDEWLMVVVPTVGPNGAEDYRKDVRLIKSMPASAMGPMSGDSSKTNATLSELIANEITDVHLSIFRTWLAGRPGAKAGTTLSYKRILNLLSPLRGTFERLASSGAVERNPFQNLKPLKKAKIATKHLESDVALPPKSGVDGFDEIVDAFTTDEIKSLLAVMVGAFKYLVAFWFFTGLRTGELIALRWDDIDWENKRMYIRRSLSRGKLKLPKFDKKRWVDLRPGAIAILQEHKKTCPTNSENLIFVNPWTGKMWADESKIRDRFQKAAIKAGVRYRRPYNCRHTYASLLLSAGEPPLYVAKQMGHADWGMLIATYGRWIPHVDQAAGTRADAALKEHWDAVLDDIRQPQPEARPQ